MYSSLIEFDDKTAYRPYNKLCAIVSGKVNLKGDGML